jgi:hypothetical protein
MAGRGRAATLPAWMTAAGSSALIEPNLQDTRASQVINRQIYLFRHFYKLIKNLPFSPHF